MFHHNLFYECGLRCLSDNVVNDSGTAQLLQAFGCWGYTLPPFQMQGPPSPPPMVNFVWATGESRYLDSTKVPACFNT